MSVKMTVGGQLWVIKSTFCCQKSKTVKTVNFGHVYVIVTFES